MTAPQIELVQANFAEIAPVAAKVATEFYNCLCALDPALRKLFGDGLSERKHKLTMALKSIVGALDRFDAVEATAEPLVSQIIKPFKDTDQNLCF